MMMTGLLAGAAKTMVVSMLSDRVVLRVLVMHAEWASAKSANTIDDKIVTEIRTKLEAVLGDEPKKLDQIVGRMHREGEFISSFKELLGGSPTARNLVSSQVQRKSLTS